MNIFELAFTNHFTKMFCRNMKISEKALTKTSEQTFWSYFCLFSSSTINSKRNDLSKDFYKENPCNIVKTDATLTTAYITLKKPNNNSFLKEEKYDNVGLFFHIF